MYIVTQNSAWHRVTDPTPDGIRKKAEIELREETGFRAGKFESYLTSTAILAILRIRWHLLVAYELEWDPFEMEDREEIRVYTFTLDEALAATREDYRSDPEAALALWLFAENRL